MNKSTNRPAMGQTVKRLLTVTVVLGLIFTSSISGQTPSTKDLSSVTTEVAIGRGYLPMCLPSTVHDIFERHHQDGPYILGQGKFAFSPSDFPNLVRPWMPNGNASMGSLRFETNPTTQEGMKFEDAGYFFYRKEDVCGRWLIAVNPATGDGLFWFKHWTVSSDLPLFSNSDYTRSFKFAVPLTIRASFETWNHGIVKKVEWQSFTSQPVRRVDFEFIQDSAMLVPVPGDYNHQARDYAVIIRFYEQIDSKAFVYEAREIIPEITFDENAVGGSEEPFHRDLEDRVLLRDDLLGKEITIYKSFSQSKENKQTLTSQLVLSFSEKSSKPGDR